MARIRTIKPSFFTDAKVAQLTRDQRLFFIGLWTLSDDHGVAEAHPKRLSAALFADDEDISSRDIREWLARLARLGLVTLLQASGGERYVHVSGWVKHQRVDKPSKFRAAVPEQCTALHPDDFLLPLSRESRECLALGSRKKEVGSRKDLIGLKTSSGSPPDSPREIADGVSLRGADPIREDPPSLHAPRLEHGPEGAQSGGDVDAHRPPPKQHLRTAQRLVSDWNEVHGSNYDTAPPSQNARKQLKRLLKEFSEGDVRLVTRWVQSSSCSQARQLRDDGFAKPSTVWRPNNFPRYLDDAKEEARKRLKPKKAWPQRVFWEDSEGRGYGGTEVERAAFFAKYPDGVRADHG